MLGESGFINYARQGYFEAIVVRYHNVYGPNMGFRHVIPHLVERFQKNESPFLIYGHEVRAFVASEGGHLVVGRKLSDWVKAS